MDHNWVTALGTVASAIAAFVLAAIAYFQLRDIKTQIRLAANQNQQTAEQDRRRNTLDACQRYEKDPLLKEAMKNIWIATKLGTDYTLLREEHHFDVITILNYFDGLASGMLQGVYIEEMAKDYLHEPLRKSVKALIRGESGDGWKADRGVFPPSHFESLMKVYDRWFPAKGVEYKAG